MLSKTVQLTVRPLAFLTASYYKVIHGTGHYLFKLTKFQYLSFDQNLFPNFCRLQVAKNMF